MWRYPDPDGRIKNGAQLIVRENQAGLVLSRGQASGIYLPGTHSLPTGNIPILSDLVGWKYGFSSARITVVGAGKTSARTKVRVDKATLQRARRVDILVG